MKLSPLRHAVAADHGVPEIEGAIERPLTPGGEAKMRKIARRMKAHGLRFDVILSSPCVRARRTAELAAEVLECPEALEITPSLGADSHPQAVVKEISQQHRMLESILVVGHEHYLSELIFVLVTGAKAVAAVMKRGGLCKLSADSLTDQRCLSLRWLLAPSQLMKIK